MAELSALLALVAGALGYGALIRSRAVRRPTQRRLRELEPIIAPWVSRAAAEPR